MYPLLFIILLLTTHNALFAMEPLHIEPSKSSSEICFFIKNIDHNIALHNRLHKEIKKEIITKYHAITNDERIASNKYEIIIDSSDYMNLSQANKKTIQMLCRTQMLGDIDFSMTIQFISKNNQTLMLSSLSEAHTDYKKILTLPFTIRCKMAAKYSSMILVKKSNYNQMSMSSKELIKNIDYFILGGLPFFSWTLGIFSEMTGESDSSVDYETLPLLPEDGEK